MKKIFPLITAETPFDGVILANGDYPTHAVPTGILRNARSIVCCDGAAAAALDHGLMPDWVIGDGDSLPAEYRERLAGRLQVITEQEFNDLTKATRFLLALPLSHLHRIAYLGATGKREDHTLGNIALIHYYVKQFDIHPTLVTDHGYFVVAQGPQQFQSFPGQQVSLFNVDCKEMRSHGLRWEAYPFEMPWQGTLNQAVSDEFEIIADRSYLVYRTF
jgi:thiamine pyrophosphokinase